MGIPQSIIDRLMSECGIISVLLVVALVYVTTQLAKTRAAWEKSDADMRAAWQKDRDGMMVLYRSQQESYEKLAVSHAKLEGLVASVRRRS